MKSSHNPSVLMFGWEFPPFNSGGLGVACEGLSKSLSASGVNLNFVLPFKVPIKASWCNFIFANEETEFKNTREVMNYVSGYLSHTDIKDKSVLVNRINGMRGNSLLERVFLYADKAGAIAEKTPHNIIHVHDWLTYPSGIEAKKATGAPLVAHIHATEFDRSGEDGNPDILEIEMEGFKKADMIVAVSGRTKKSVEKYYGINPNKVKVVHNGVDFQKSESAIPKNLSDLKVHGAKIVLFAGRITMQKGPDYFVAMAEQVLRYEPNTYFVISGSGDMEEYMVREVARRGISNKFIFCGFLRGEELASVYKVADIYVMPSVSEPFGILPLEVMISDTPVLISKESGVSEVVSSVLKSNFWDVDDMTDKVISVLRHSHLHTHLRVNGKQEVKGIHWKKAADSLINLYNSLTPAPSLSPEPAPIFMPAYARG